MAKNRSSERDRLPNGESKQGLVIALVFFVLTTIIAGVLAYYGYAEQEALAAKAKKAGDELKTAKDELSKEQTARAVLKISMGIADEADRKTFEGNKDQQVGKDAIDTTFKAMAPFKNRLAAAQTKIRDITGRMTDDERNQANTILNPVMERLDQEISRRYQNAWVFDPAKPDPQGVQSLLDTMDYLLIDLEKEKAGRTASTEALVAARNDASNQVGVAMKAKATAEKGQNDAKQQNLQDKKEESKAFQGAQTSLAEKGNELEDKTRKSGEREAALEKEIRGYKNAIKDKDLLIAKMRQQIQLPDAIQLDEAKGRILSADHRNGRVRINLGATDLLKPGVTFSVYPQGTNGKAAAGRDRKGAIEVTDILGAHEAEARIVEQTDAIRDMILREDLVFNPAWNPNLRERIALTGMIDLNGDGLDDNEEFVRLMERQGVIVDAWLDLKDLQVKGPGMTLKTSYLVFGESPNVEGIGAAASAGIIDPRLERKKQVLEIMGKMQTDARDLGVQAISTRRFLSMIGYKLPKNPTPPDYGSGKYLRGAGKSPADKDMPEKEKDAAPPPKGKAADKKDENGKKDE
jgi:hypothetical protein